MPRSAGCAHRIEFGHGSVDVAKALLLDEAHPERRVRCVKVGVEVDDRRQVGLTLQLVVAAGGWRPAASAWSPLGHEPNRNVKGGFIPFNNTATVRSPPAPAEKNRTRGTIYV